MPAQDTGPLAITSERLTDISVSKIRAYLRLSWIFYDKFTATCHSERICPQDK